MDSQKNCIIIHGCPDIDEDRNPNIPNNSIHWYPWVKTELIKRGIQTEIPLMPEPWSPEYEKFKREFEKYEINENSILVGHSCGCAFLVRWLGETKIKISRLILVAPWKIPEGGDFGRERFYNYEIDESIKERVGHIIMLTSDNEEPDGKKSLEIFNKVLGGMIIEFKGKGHFTSGDMGALDFPELIEVIIAG